MRTADAAIAEPKIYRRCSRGKTRMHYASKQKQHLENLQQTQLCKRR